jgi:dynein heavy chain
MVEKYGAQPPIELLRQVVDYGGFYDQKKLFWKQVVDTQFIAACGPPGGGRNKVTPRMFRHFNMVWMPALSTDAMNKILSGILGGWLGTTRDTLKDLAEPITKATVDGYFRITADLLPTPVKCHYTFNLRDPAKMIQGMMMVDVAKSLNKQDDLLRLWLHESARVFRDRLINDHDSAWFNSMIKNKMKEHLKVNWEEEVFDDLFFGDFMDQNDKKYIYLDDPEVITQKFQEYLDEYNITFPTQMNLVFFADCKRHVARISRVLSQPRGNGLLVGVSGVGRKSVGRLGAFIQEIQPFSIEITRNYDLNTFNEDIKAIMFQVAKGFRRCSCFRTRKSSRRPSWRTSTTC